jgi:superfamily II DNA/RNA helicase
MKLWKYRCILFFIPRLVECFLHDFGPRRSFYLNQQKSPPDSGFENVMRPTASHLEKLETAAKSLNSEHDVLYNSFLQRSASSLKEELKMLGLPNKGRKPDLAQRLVDNQLKSSRATSMSESEESAALEEEMKKSWRSEENVTPLKAFAGLDLSLIAGKALASATFSSPSPIQEIAIPRLAKGESAILHAETGSGKTLAYLLPITEQLWREDHNDDYDDERGFGVILTPTRELATQVAGIAQALSPPGTVRLIFRPTNLMGDPLKEHGEEPLGGLLDRRSTRATTPRLYVGSAKAIMTSLYGDGKMPASPTTKPEAVYFLQNVRWLVLDEVDRILHVKKSRGEGERNSQHEKPAAIITSAVARRTLGKAQIVAVSATVGRPLRRELSRVMGLSPEECPPVIRETRMGDTEDDKSTDSSSRAVTIPGLVKNYVIAVDSDSTGKILTVAFETIKRLNKKPRKMLLVLTKGCGMSTKNTIGALNHFQCHPKPISLLDSLQADGSDSMISSYRKVSGAMGIGESNDNHNVQINTESDDDLSTREGSLLVTGEDSVRGLHLDSLDTVIVVGHPYSADEYTHIAGRTGRAGKGGNVITIVSLNGAKHFQSWERMLNVKFEFLDVEDVVSLN